MAHAHDHPSHAHAARPTLSLLRMSAGQRLGLAAAILVLLWAVTAMVVTVPT